MRHNILKGTNCRKTQFLVTAVQSQYDLKVNLEMSHILYFQYLLSKLLKEFDIKMVFSCENGPLNSYYTVKLSQILKL